MSDKRDRSHLTFRWLGSENAYLDTLFTTSCGDVIIGCYGGSTLSGAHRNEDAALVWCGTDGGWKFAVILDAHKTAQSAELVLNTIELEQEKITKILSQAVEAAFPLLHQFLVGSFSSETFRRRCKQIQGETACLVCVQKEQFLLWFSVGDCLVYLLHSELAQFGQYTLNQRNFFEWIGQVNTFDLPVACYSSGVRELRQGESCIVMVTDGLLECGSRPFENQQYFYEVFTSPCRMEANVRNALQKVREARGGDSATVIHWRYNNLDRACVYPST
jgi:serine/threonine protein phosphatase PrpC